MSPEAGAGKWRNASVYVSLIGRFEGSCQLYSVHFENSVVICMSQACFSQWFNKGHVVYYHVYLIMHVKGS